MGSLMLSLVLAAATAAQSSTDSLWSGTATPGTPSANDPGSVEVGVKFTSDVDGAVMGIRFYKGSGNTGTHIGNLWTLSGTNLAAVTFTGESASGWQQMNFANPVPITANTPYVASYFCPAGHYAADNGFFSIAYDNPPLHALQDGAQGGDGVFVYGAASAFPIQTYQSSNYWVDVMFSPAPSPPSPTPSPTPASGSSNGLTRSKAEANCGAGLAEAGSGAGLSLAAALVAALLGAGARGRSRPARRT